MPFGPFPICFLFLNSHTILKTQSSTFRTRKYICLHGNGLQPIDDSVALISRMVLWLLLTWTVRRHLRPCLPLVQRSPISFSWWNSFGACYSTLFGMRWKRCECLSIDEPHKHKMTVLGSTQRYVTRQRADKGPRYYVESGQFLEIQRDGNKPLCFWKCSRATTIHLDYDLEKEEVSAENLSSLRIVPNEGLWCLVCTVVFLN